MTLRFRDLSVGRRLTVAFGMIGLLLVVLVGVAAAGDISQANLREELSTDVSARRDVLQLKYATADMNGWQTAYAFEASRAGGGDVVDDEQGSRKRFLDAAESFRAALSTVTQNPALDDYASDAEDVSATFDEYMALDDRVVALYQEGTPEASDEADTISLGPTNDLADGIAEATQRVVKALNERATLHEEAGERKSTVTLVILFGTGLVTLLLAAVLAIRMTLSMTRPIRRTVGLLQEVAGGDLRGRVADPGADELGQMGTALNETLEQMSQTVDGISQGSTSLSAASEELSSVSQQMSAAAEETAVQAGSVSAAAEQVSNSVQSVSAGTEQLGGTLSEIASSTTEAARVAGQAVQAAEQANVTVLRLGSSSAEIGEVVKVITSIAEQTNMLALNATIEAARAGDVGKGFAVVAGEVKDLARKTATSSEEIGRKVATIQQDTAAAVEAISQITEVIQQISDIQTVIAAAVEEQSVTTNEIGRSVSEAAVGVSDIARNISGVAETARGTTQGATDTHGAAEEMSRLAADLLTLVRRFTLEGRPPVIGVASK